MATQVIFHHEDSQRVSLLDFLRPFWVVEQGTPLPPTSELNGKVPARVNHGRWLVDCPGGCPNAIIVSQVEPYFICIVCGSEENGGRWYAVVFPRDKAKLEAELLKRPARKAFEAGTRNWVPGETVAMVRRENREHGIG